MSANSRIRFGLLIVLVLFVQYISLSSLCKLIWRHWTYIKCLSDKFCRVCEWDLAYSLSYPLYNMWGCVFVTLPIYLVMIERIYILCRIIIIKLEIWTITHCLGLGHETMVCAVCLSMFLCITYIFRKYIFKYFVCKDNKKSINIILWRKVPFSATRL